MESTVVNKSPVSGETMDTTQSVGANTVSSEIASASASAVTLPESTQASEHPFEQVATAKKSGRSASLSSAGPSLNTFMVKSYSDYRTRRSQSEAPGDPNINFSAEFSHQQSHSVETDSDDEPIESDHDLRAPDLLLSTNLASGSISGAAPTRPNGDPSNDLVAQSAALASGESSLPRRRRKRGTGGRRNKTYLLPDGSIVSGKGLGRGRPGIKRGPRNQSNANPDGTPLPNGLGKNRSAAESAPKPKKRKRADSDASSNSSDSESEESTSRESSVEYQPTSTHTRSGRQTQKPPSLVTAVLPTPSPARKMMRQGSTTGTPVTQPSAAKSHPKIKRRIYRGREQLALCEHCLRGHGPPGNAIVFCDACNKCWHQRCHDPRISKQTVADSRAEWFCVDCDRILNKARKSKKTTDKASGTPVATAPSPIVTTPVYAGPRVGGRYVPPQQKTAYLNTLSRDQLISLLLHASDLAPELPMFETLQFTPSIATSAPQAQFTSTYVTPVSRRPDPRNGEDAEGDEGLDEGYDGYFDEHAALYPKPGGGIKLPPESEDMHLLLEGKESRTFSHWVRGMGGVLFSGTGNIS